MESPQLIELLKAINEIKETLSNQSNEWLAVYAAIGGAFVGAISTYFPTLFIEKHKVKSTSNSIKVALVTEVEVILNLIEARSYLSGIQEIINKLEQNPELTHSYQVDVPPHYSRIYQTHVSNLGLLDPKLVKDIVSFYQLLDAIIQDIKPGGTIGGNFVGLDHFKELHKMMSLAIKVGDRIKNNT